MDWNTEYNKHFILKILPNNNLKNVMKPFFKLTTIQFITNLFVSRRIALVLCCFYITCNLPRPKIIDNSLSEFDLGAKDSGFQLIADVQIVAGKKVQGELVINNNLAPFERNQFLEKDDDGFYYRDIGTGTQYSFNSNGNKILLNNCTVFGVDSAEKVFSFRDGEVLITVNDNFHIVMLDDGITLRPTKGTRINITAYKNVYDSTLRITAIDTSTV